MEQTREQWERLVAEVGLAEATRRIMAENHGQGDSVRELRDVWEGMGPFQIYEAILSDQPTDST